MAEQKTILRVVGDGTLNGTRVLDENGKMIGGIERISLVLDERNQPYVQLTFRRIHVDLNLILHEVHVFIGEKEILDGESQDHPRE